MTQTKKFKTKKRNQTQLLFEKTAPLQNFEGRSKQQNPFKTCQLLDQLATIKMYTTPFSHSFWLLTIRGSHELFLLLLSSKSPIKPSAINTNKPKNITQLLLEKTAPTNFTRTITNNFNPIYCQQQKKEKLLWSSIRNTYLKQNTDRLIILITQET